MGQTTADIMIERLIDWGVDTVFGIPGDGINGIMEALRQAKEKVRFVQVRHEEAAAFMACAYSKFTGRLGVCLATSGPGAIHLLNGLYDAKLDSTPVLALTGQTYHDLLGTRFQQEVNLLQLYSDVAVYNQMIMGPEHVQSVVDVACRNALAERGVSHITCPNDYQEMPASKAHVSMMNVKGHTSREWRPPVSVPPSATLQAAASLLNEGKRSSC